MCKYPPETCWKCTKPSVSQQYFEEVGKRESIFRTIPSPAPRSQVSVCGRKRPRKVGASEDGNVLPDTLQLHLRHEIRQRIVYLCELLFEDLGDLYAESRQTVQGSFSAVSKQASKQANFCR